MTVPSSVLDALQDFQQWKAGRDDFDLLDYVGCVATPDLFYAFLSLLNPELIRHDGELFLASHFERSTYDEWIARVGDPVEAQKAMNHIHVSTLFQGQVVPDAVATDVSKRIAEHWSRMFSSDGLVAEAFGASFDDAQVTLYRRRGSP